MSCAIRELGTVRRGGRDDSCGPVRISSPPVARDLCQDSRARARSGPEDDGRRDAPHGPGDRKRRGRAAWGALQCRRRPIPTGRRMVVVRRISGYLPRLSSRDDRPTHRFHAGLITDLDWPPSVGIRREYGVTWPQGLHAYFKSHLECSSFRLLTPGDVRCGGRCAHGRRIGSRSRRAS